MKLNPMSEPPKDDRVVLLFLTKTECISGYYQPYSQFQPEWKGFMYAEDGFGYWDLFSPETILGWIECPAIDIEETGA